MGDDRSDYARSALSRVLGSGAAGLLELCIFHPVDTITKRLMNDTTNIMASQKFSDILAQTGRIVFKDKANAPALSKYMSLFPGFGSAVGYKISQRIYKFGGQPIVNDFLLKEFQDSTIDTNSKGSKIFISALSGSLIGVGEVILLPLDSLKIKLQTASPQNRVTALQLARSEGIMNLYRGAQWTAARNVPGSFALFGASSLTKEHVFGLENHNKATFVQDLASSVVGAVTCIMVSSPLDVIKTRVQASSSSAKVRGFDILRNMILKEGFLSLYKGVTPKTLIVGPKLIFG